MKTLWFITNPNSGTATHKKCEALEAVFEEAGLQLAGRTQFPQDGLPDPAALDRAGVDTVVLFAGDGTINAALCALADWEGAFLILPGGTMNKLAKALHGDTDPHAIVHAAHQSDRRVSLPFVEAAANRAFVGVIVGPASHWVRAREAVRDARWKRLLRAVRHAWRRTFDDAVRVEGAPGLRDGYQAVYVEPSDTGLRAVGIDARDWKSILQLGWDWVTGDWVAANAATEARAPELRIRSAKPVMALFDGEPVQLDPGTAITSGTSRRSFIATREDAA